MGQALFLGDFPQSISFSITTTLEAVFEVYFIKAPITLSAFFHNLYIWIPHLKIPPSPRTLCMTRMVGYYKDN
jgi:hypothetical protein